jgi:hypothetical protein
MIVVVVLHVVEGGDADVHRHVHICKERTTTILVALRWCAAYRWKSRQNDGVFVATNNLAVS